MSIRRVLFAIYLFFTVWNLYAIEPTDRAGIVHVTHFDNDFELKPKFVLGGDAIAFLVFAGNPIEPGLSDYRLCVTDLSGKTLIYKSDVGVIDYHVRPGGEQLELIMAVRASQKVYREPDDFDFTAWEIWELDIHSRELHFVESAHGQALRAAYEKLNIPVGQVVYNDSYKLSSPNQSHHVSIKLERHQEHYDWGFYTKAKKFLFSEAWLSYTDVEWVPPIFWMTNDIFLTVGFTSEKDSGFSQSKGIFSIIKVDLSQQKKSILYQKRSLQPIAKLFYNDHSDELFFQAPTGDLGMRLYKLNLFTGNAEILYETAGDLGRVHIDPSGSSLIFADFNEQNSDVIRLDLDRKSVRLAAR